MLVPEANVKLYNLFLAGMMLGLSAYGAGMAYGEDLVTVKTAIESAFDHNHHIQALKENRTAVEHEIDKAKAGYKPRIDLNLRYGYGKLDNSTTRQYNLRGWGPYSSGSLILTQPIWDGGLTESRVRESEATFRSMEHRVLDNANSLALDVLIAQTDVIRCKTIFDLASKNAARHEEILAKAQDRASLGLDTAADVNQAKSRLSRAKSSLTEARGQLRQAEENYSRLTGLAPQNLEEVPVPADGYTSIDMVLDDAEKYNPKIASYLEDIKASGARRDEAKAANMPNLSIEAGPSFSDRNGKKQMYTYEIGITGVLRWNLLNGGADAASIKAANARIRQTRQELFDYADELRLAILSTWQDYEMATEQFEFYTDAAGFNTITRDSYEDQFVMGDRSLLDVLDIENELFNSNTQINTSKSNKIIALYKLHALAGNLLPLLGIDPEVLKNGTGADGQEDEELHWTIK